MVAIAVVATREERYPDPTRTCLGKVGDLGGTCSEEAHGAVPG